MKLSEIHDQDFKKGDRVITPGGNHGVIQKISGTGHVVVEMDPDPPHSPKKSVNAFEKRELKRES